MKRIAILFLPVILAILGMAAACSTTATLAEDELRLAENKVAIKNSSAYKASKLQPYIKQKANTYIIGKWQPFLYVYNWQNGKDGGWDNFCRKVGQAPVVYDEGQVNPSVRSMLNHLEYEGWYDSTIETQEIVNEKRRSVKVEYDVTLGHQFPLQDIKYVVRDPGLDSLVRADSTHFTLKSGDPLAQSALEAESERLSQIFRNNGYWGFTKNHFFFYADTTTTPGVADLFVHVENYTRNESEEDARTPRKYHLGQVSLTPQPGMRVRPKFLHNLNQLQPGELYSEERINRTYDRFSSIPLFSNVNMILRQSESDSSAVDCAIFLQQARLQSIKLNLEGSFNSTGLFGITPALSYSHKNLFGGGEVLSLGFRGNFQFMLRSPTRANEFAVNTGLSIPWYPSFVWKMQSINLPQMDINFAYNYQNRPEYTRRIVTGAYGFSWNVDKRWYWQINPVQLSAINASRIDESFIDRLSDPYLLNSFRSHIDLGGNGTVYYTTDPSVNPKTTYFYARFQYDLSGNFLSLFNNTKLYTQGSRGERCIAGIPYAQYARGEFQVVQTFRLGYENQFALAVRGLAGLGYAYGNSISLPFEKLFYAGGANSMRGWRARAVGPGNAPRDSSFTIANQSGDMHLETNIEFRFPMFWKLQGALFVDAGNVWNIGKEDAEIVSRDPRSLFSFKNLAKSTAMDWGLGLRLDFGMILVRFDMGLRLYDPLDMEWKGINDWLFDDQYAFHFGIGYPF